MLSFPPPRSSVSPCTVMPTATEMPDDHCDLKLANDTTATVIVGVLQEGRMRLNWIELLGGQTIVLSIRLGCLYRYTVRRLDGIQPREVEIS